LFRKDDNPTVYTTESGRICPKCGKPAKVCICNKDTASLKTDGTVRLILQTKGRGGKTVTLITGLALDTASLEHLASDLKRQCGAGGTSRDGLIEIQGDHRETLLVLLKQRGFPVKKAGG
jgi:translation initiation factor 1